MTATTDRKVVVALVIIVSACLVGLGGSLYRIKSSELSTLQQELTRKQAERDEVKAKIARMPELEAKYADLQQRLAILEPTLPSRAYIPTFLRQIENLAAGTANGIVSIRPQEKKKTATAKKATKINSETGEVIKDDDKSKSGGKDGGKAESGTGGAASKGEEAEQKPSLPYGFVPIELQIQGTYWTQIEFLKQLQRFPKMIAVNSVGFSPDLRSGTAHSLTAVMDLTAVVSEHKTDEAKGEKNGKAS